MKVYIETWYLIVSYLINTVYPEIGESSFSETFITIYAIIFSWDDSTWWARSSLLSRLHDHTQTLHTRWDSSGRVISPSHTLLPGNTRHSKERDLHAPGGIRTRNPSKLTTSDPHLRPLATGNRSLRDNRVIIKKVALHSYKVKPASNGTARDRNFFTVLAGFF